MRTPPLKTRAPGNTGAAGARTTGNRSPAQQSAQDVSTTSPPPIKGRGVSCNPPNRFEALHVEMDPPDPDEDSPRTVFIPDATRTVLSKNNSPDISFSASVNPYRGCEHGCAYCYARPTHEYLGMSAGLDFERKILVKKKAPELLRRELSAPSWRPRTLAVSGVTDPYQPVERRLRLTRGCLRVLRDFRNPVAIVTKNHLVTRDIDLLGELARHRCARVFVSVTTLRNDLARVMEPRTSIPARRLDAIARLAEAKIPVGVFVAPVVPGLTDEEMPAILKAAAGAGAEHASFLLLRLPGAVAGLFDGWLETHFPGRRNKVLARLREARGGKLNESRFHKRFRADGQYAAQLLGLFRATARSVGLATKPPSLSTEAYRRGGGVQGDLFAD